MTPRAPALLAAVCLAAGFGAVPALAQKAKVEKAAEKVSPGIATAIIDGSRPPEDVKRDPERKPAEVLDFAGVKSGMKVGELFPGGGYYTRLLSKVVGNTGKVYLLTPDKFQDKQKEAVDKLVKDNGNTVALWQPSDAPKTPELVDVVWNSDNYHDYRNPGFGPADMTKFNKAVFDMIKPGGEYIVLDYEAAPGVGDTQTATNHRIESATVKKEVEAAGFKFESASPALQNTKDDHTQKVFAMQPRGSADQFILKFRKPR